MLKIITLSILDCLSHIKFNKNKLNINSSSSIDSSKINNKIANLLSNIKKMDSQVNFLNFEASLAFNQIKKVFTKT